MDEAEDVLGRIKTTKYYHEFEGLTEIPEPMPSESGSRSGRSYRPPSLGSASMDSASFADPGNASFKSCVSSMRSIQSIAPELSANSQSSQQAQPSPSRSNKLRDLASAASAATAAGGTHATAAADQEAAELKAGSGIAKDSDTSDTAKDSAACDSGESSADLLGETRKAEDKTDA